MSYFHFLKQPPAVFPRFFCLQTTDSHILAHVNIECPDDRYSKLDIYISKLILDSYEYILAACQNALHDMTIISLTVARFVGTGGFLIRYSNGHSK